MQHLARDATKVIEHLEEVTRARAATIMEEVHTSQAERMALSATTYGDGDELAWRVYFLEGELVAAYRAWDAAKEKLPSLDVNAVVGDRRWVAVEERCERLVHELTLPNLRGSVMCRTIIGAPL
jgi:hypothetical protein